jgi:hypothetical protein
VNSIIETATAVGSFKTLAVAPTAADIGDNRKGPQLAIDTISDVMVNNAKLVAADDGFIHAIDTVLIPK